MPNTIDVHDLTEEQVEVIQKLVELLRGKKLRDRLPKKGVEEAKDEGIVFTSWPLGVKGKLTREEIYDYL